MLQVFPLPDLGEGLTESEIVSWNVSEGDSVELNQVLGEVETAKAVVELPSPYAGVIGTLHAGPGDVVLVGAPLVTFELEGEEPAGQASEAAAGRTPSLVGYGAAVDAGGPAKRRRSRGGRGTTALVDAPSASPADQAAPVREEPPTVQTPSPLPASPGGPVAPDSPGTPRDHRPRATPPVRKLARDGGVDLASLAGSGADGLITRDDVTAALAAAARSLVGPPALSDGTAPPGFVTQPGQQDQAPVRTLGGKPRTWSVPVKGVRKATAQAMTVSVREQPQVTEFLTVDVTPSLELVERLRGSRDFSETKLSILPLVAKAVLVALEREPALNARWEGESLLMQSFVNLGIAAATERGLVVPNIPDAQAMSLKELARAIGELAATARAGKTPMARLTGGTFTLTNVGVFGVDAGTPILNPGETGILAIGAVRRQPWGYRGEVALRHVMTLALTFDHRVVDGAEGSRFLADVGAILADPGMTLTML